MSTIVYCCPFVPAEWIAAHGLAAARIVPAGPSEIRNPKSEIEVYAGVCPFARGFAGSALGFDDAAGIVVTTASDQMRRISEWLAERSERPVFLMNVPSTCTTSARELYASEVRRLGAFLEALGGASPSDEKLARVMMDKEAARATESRDPPQPHLAKGGRGQASLAKGGRSGPVHGEGGKVALAVVGGPLLEEDLELFEMIARAGGRVVLDGT